MQRRTKIKTYITAFTPSTIGVVLYLFLSSFIIFLHQVPAIKNYLQIPNDFNLLHAITGSVNDLLTKLIGEGRTETLVVGTFWAVVGLAVYLFLLGIVYFVTDFSVGLEQRSFLWPKGTDRNRGLWEALQRTIFRILAFAGLVFVVFVPLARILDGPVFVDLVGPDAALRFGVWLLSSMLVMHLCVVFMRLVLLRPRILD